MKASQFVSQTVSHVGSKLLSFSAPALMLALSVTSLTACTQAPASLDSSDSYASDSYLYPSGTTSAVANGTQTALIYLGTSVTSAGCNYQMSEVGETGGGAEICAGADYIQSGSQVIAAITLTANGAHISNPACPTGFTLVGTIPDCDTSNYCSGTQSLCALMANASATSQIITNVYLTQPGAHVSAPGCLANYTYVGQTADCGGGYCSGAQYLCTSHN